MKLFRFILIIVATSLFCTAGFAYEAGDDYTLPGGRVLKNPYIVEKKPNGVVVGHSTGVMFIKYKKLPEGLRKQLGYEPAKSAKYEEKKRKRKKARRERNVLKNAKKAKFNKELKIRRGKYKIYELVNKIKATELRIKRLKLEIPKLEADKNNFLSQAVSLSSGSSSNSGGGFSRNGLWGGGNSSSKRSSNRREVKNRFKAVKVIGEEYSSSKFRLSNYKDELERKILNLDKMKDNLRYLKNEQGVKEGKKSGFFSKFF